MFSTVLVANRGEIAVRVIRTLRALGIGSVAVYSDADAEARHVREADRAVRIGPAAARESYLSIPALIDAARRTGAEAVHPGYGFLSENAGFARACAEAGLVFVGPPVTAVEIMGDKISAKQAVVASGVPVVPGRFEPGMSDADLSAAALEVGFPVLVKPAAGGGGKGMRLVTGPDELPAALVSARREALSSFGDGTLFVERFVARPRHIEVQVLADAHGQVIHLGERECSLQRRQQKIVEEAPSVLLDPPTRARIGAAAVEIARSVGYLGVGTVEFIVSADRPEEFFFLEMNTRLQVEHPVTELVTGLDLVAEQLRVAAGERLRLGQDQVRISGHAIEARVYAEDPDQGFLPTGGRVLALREPEIGPAGPRKPGLVEPGAAVGGPEVVAGSGGPAVVVRVDSGLAVGSEIGPWYDPMLSKVIAWAPDRAAALAGLRDALARTAILGVTTNLGFLGHLLADPDVVAGRLDTQLVDRELPRLIGAPASDRDREQALAVYGLVRLRAREVAAERAARSRPVDRLWASPSGWRLAGPSPLRFRVAGPSLDDEPTEVEVIGPVDAASVRVGAGSPIRIELKPSSPGSDGELRVSQDGIITTWLHAVEPESTAGPGAVWLSSAGRTWVLAEAPPPVRASARRAGGSDVRSPMPGVVLAVTVEVGDQVEAGQALVVVEAMKMEYAVTAAAPGTVQDLPVKVGDQVRLGQLLAGIG